MAGSATLLRVVTIESSFSCCAVSFVSTKIYLGVTCQSRYCLYVCLVYEVTFPTIYLLDTTVIKGGGLVGKGILFKEFDSNNFCCKWRLVCSLSLGLDKISETQVDWVLRHMPFLLCFNCASFTQRKFSIHLRLFDISRMHGYT